MEKKLIIKHLPHFKPVLLISFFLFFYACGNDHNEAQKIVDKAIDAHGGKAFEKIFISFDFRDRNYTISRNGGMFTYTRAFSDSLGNVKDVLDNKGFTRFINGEIVELTDEWKKRYTASVNGVVYFALLPFPLNDPAVIKELIGEDSIEGQSYHQIKVTFAKEGGGEDYSDNFIYWIHKDNYTMDYFAYDYETDGGGSRFREAVNPRKVGNILFQDYKNFEPLKPAPLENYSRLFENGQLREISLINLENLEAKPLN